MRKQILSVFMAFALTLTLLPANAIAFGLETPSPNQSELEDWTGEEMPQIALPEPETFFLEYTTAAELDSLPFSTDRTIDDFTTFGAQLSGNAKVIYDALCANIDMIRKGDPVYAELETKVFTDESQEEIITFVKKNVSTEGISEALAAFGRDHSEVFWTGGMNYGTFNKQNGIEFTSFAATPGTYTKGIKIMYSRSSSWANKTSDEIKADEQIVADIVDKIAAEAQKFTSTVDQLGYVNDWLTKSNAYNRAAGDSSYTGYQSNYKDTDSTPWTALSALDSRFSPVCEGYARAFKLICDKLGIPCVLISGLGDGGAHMWNYVKIDDIWYAVDVTWNDPILSGGGDGNGNRNYFLKGETNFGSHVPQSNNFLSQGHMAFDYPTLSVADYMPPVTSGETKTTLTVNGTGSVTVGYGDEITLTAMVTNSAGQLVQRGSVMFACDMGTDKDNTIPVTNGVASYTFPADMEAETYNFLAMYTDDSDAYEYSDAEVSVTVTTKTLNASNTKVTVHPPEGGFVYRGRPWAPGQGAGDGGVVVSIGKSLLIKDTDYTLAYHENQNAGDATVAVTGIGYYAGTAWGTFQIAKATPDLGDITIGDNTIYSTTPVSTILSLLESSNKFQLGGTWALTGKDANDVIAQSGAYEYVFTPADAKNYNSVTGTVQINVKQRTVESITVTTEPTKIQYIYGEEFNPEGLVLSVKYNDSETPETVAYSKTSGITWTPEKRGNVGTNPITFKYNGVNAEPTVNFYVSRKPVDLSGIAWNVPAGELIYNSREQSIELGTIPSEVKALFDIVLTGSKAINAGSYNAVATLTLKSGFNANNYKVTGGTDTESPARWTISKNWSIAKLPLSLDGVSWNVTQAEIPYDGKEHTVSLSAYPDTFKITNVSGDKGTNVGTYTPTATFALADNLNADNYELPAADKLTAAGPQWTITPAKPSGHDASISIKLGDPKVKTVTAQQFGTVPGTFALDWDKGQNTVFETGYPKVTENGIEIKLDASAGTETTVEIPVTLTPADTNYQPLSLNLIVNLTEKTPVTVTSRDFEKIYDGTPVTQADVESGLTTSVPGTWTIAEGAVLPTNVGDDCVIEMRFVPADSASYTRATAQVQVKITPAAVTITPKSYTVTVGDPMPEFECDVTGLVGADKLTTPPALSCGAADTAATGEYPITAKDAAAGSNYTITYVEGKLTVSAPVPVAAPTASPAVTTFTDYVDVTLVSATEGANIYYTTDGTAPVESSTLYETPIHITETTTLRAIAVKAGLPNSAEVSFIYTKQTPVVPAPDPQPPAVQTAVTPVINPAGGVFYGAQQVTITTATPGASIYYTTDGTTPTASSALYTGAITLYNSATVSAVAAAPGMNDSASASAVFTRYTYIPVNPAPEPDPEPDDPYVPPVSSNTNNSANQNSTSTPGNHQTTAPAQPVQLPVVPEVTTRPEAAVSGETASAVVTADAVEKLVEQAVSGRSDAVVIAPVISGGVTRTEVTLPASAVSTIASQTSAALKVETTVAEITIPNSSLSGLSRQGAEIAVTAEKAADNTVEIAVAVDGQKVENVAIKAAIPAPCGPGTVAKIVDADGNIRSTVRKSSASSDGKTMTVPLDGSAKVVFVENTRTFSDVPAANWAADAVAFASSHELMNGTGDDSFAPSATMTRAMLAVVLHNLEGSPGAANAASFRDVSGSTWYADAVQWAAGKGVINGVSDGVFAPDSAITREQLVLMLYRYVGQPTASGSAMGRFTDAADVSDWAAQAMSWAVSSGIVNGSNGALNPQGSATRAEVAQMLMNFVSSGVL